MRQTERVEEAEGGLEGAGMLGKRPRRTTTRNENDLVCERLMAAVEGGAVGGTS